VGGGGMGVEGGPGGGGGGVGIGLRGGEGWEGEEQGGEKEKIAHGGRKAGAMGGRRRRGHRKVPAGLCFCY